MAEFLVRAEAGGKNAHRVSVASADLDVKDGKVDLSGLNKDLRARVEFELDRAGVVVRADSPEAKQDAAAQRAAEKAEKAASEAAKTAESDK